MSVHAAATRQGQNVRPAPRLSSLRMSQPGDRYERAADSVAAAALRSTSARASGADLSSSAPHVSELGGAGRPLAADVRSYFEPKFGHDFSQVRVHDTTHAANMAQSVNALAFTAGQDIVFDAGRYQPDTQTGRSLLAHELAHVVQQDHEPQALGVHRASRCDGQPACDVPDVPGNSVPTAWDLTLAVDVEQHGLGRLISGNVGHTWVKFQDNGGTRYSYGFWPQGGFDPKKPFKSVPGCVRHPDVAHEPPKATNYSEKKYSIPQDKYLKALTHAQSVCIAKPDYNLFTYNCTSFGIDVTKAAGVTPPSSTTLAVHNPNALSEGIAENRDEGHPGLGALLGGLGGAGVGAGVGALLGGPVGAVVGGLIGAAAGALGGAAIGDKV